MGDLLSVAVFARAPVPGRVKTRLVPRLGARGAAALHRRLLHRALATAVAAATGPVELWCTPDTHHPGLRRAASRHGLRLRRQRGRDLGERMRAALVAGVTRAGCAAVIGCDCPALAARHLRRAAAWLEGGAAAVIGPARDGGYVLLAVRAAPPAALFEGIAWGGPGVLADTRRRLAALGWPWRELEPLPDVDRPGDLDRLPAGLLAACRCAR